MSVSSNNIETIVHSADLRMKLVIQGGSIGVLSGLTVVLYRFLLETAKGWRQVFFRGISGSAPMILGGLALLACFGLIVGWMVKREPLVSGSGIPQIEGLFHDKPDINCRNIVLGKLVGGVMTLGAGLSLGRENHQIGASVALWFSRVFGRVKVEEKYLITAGASAGLAAAFNTPIAGVIFALEQVHRHFSPLVLLSATTAAVTADVISKGFFGVGYMFNFPALTPVPLRSYFLFLVLGAALGVLGMFFKYLLSLAAGEYQRRKWLPDYMRPVLPFIATGLFALFFPYVIGDGRQLVETLVDTRLGLGLVALILAAKFFFTIFCYGSGVPGGSIVPLLALGALVGNLFGQAVNPALAGSFTVIAMVGMFAAVMRAPVTGTVLIAEMTGSISLLLPLAIVAISAYAAADLFNSKLDYQTWLNKLLALSDREDPDTNKVLLEIGISLGSIFDGSAVKDCELPPNCLLVSILRGGEELIPRGDTLVCSGDILTVLTSQRHAPYVKKMLLSRAGSMLEQIS